MVGTLIPVYSGYGDTLLLRLPGVAPNVNPRFWLIDGGPITSSRTVDEGEKNAYQQYLKLALARYCRQNPNSHEINLLEGIVVTHPDADHIDGIIQLLEDWLPDNHSYATSANKPLLFHGPIILNSACFSPSHSELANLLLSKCFTPVTYNRDANPNYPTQYCSTWLYSFSRNNDNKLTTLQQPFHQDLMGDLSKQLSRAPQQNHTIDSSMTNAGSIMTVTKSLNVLNQPQFDIITTGDGLAAYISFGMKHVPEIVRNLPVGAIPVVNVFKVPHHGSKANSQLGNIFPLSEDMTRQHTFLALGLCFLEGQAAHVPASVAPRLGYLDKTRQTILDNIPLEFKHVDLTGLDKPALVTRFANAFKNEVLKKVDYIDDDPASFITVIAGNKQVKLGGKRAKKLIDTAGVATEIVWLLLLQFAEFYNDEVPATAYSIDRLWYEDTTKAWVTQTLERDNDIRSDLRAHAQTVVNWLREKTPELPAELAKRTKQFYLTFRAKYYVISANGTHGHPSPPLMAGLIAACKDHHATTNEKANIVLTDGLSAKLDAVKRILDIVCKGNLPASWNDVVNIYCFENDILAPVPFENGVVPTTLSTITFGPNVPDYIPKLRKAFNAALDVNIPRAVDPSSARFVLQIEKFPPPTQPEYLAFTLNMLQFAVFSISNQQTVLSIEAGTQGSRWKAQKVDVELPLLPNISVYGPWVKLTTAPLIGGPIVTNLPVFFRKSGAVSDVWTMHKEDQTALCYNAGGGGGVDWYRVQVNTNVVKLKFVRL